MREEIYNEIRQALAGIADSDGNLAVQHIDLWNRNVEFIEQEEAWPRPAVFVEFHPIQWKVIVPGIEYRADVQVSLHVVTDWDAEDSTTAFSLIDAVHHAVVGLQGETFAELDLLTSSTNHNHEDIVENIETYSCTGIRSL